MRQVFRTVVDEVEWMNEETKATAHKKLEKLIEAIGYPDEMIDEAEMEKAHEGLPISEGDYFKSVLQIQQ